MNESYGSGVMHSSQISPHFIEAIIKCLSGRPEILFAILYGSAATGHSFRDLDIGLFVDRSLVPVDEELDFAFSLTDELKQVVSYPVDVRIINDSPLPFRYNVSQGQSLVVNDPDSFTHFLEQTWDEYLDFHPVAMQYLKDLS